MGFTWELDAHLFLKRSLVLDTQFGGSGIYWNEPDGHQWEMLTVGYARPQR